MKKDWLTGMVTAHAMMVVFCLISAGYAFAFDGNMYADLAIGVPYEKVSDFEEAGIFHILYSSASGVTTDNNLYFSQNSAGMDDECEALDRFGFSMTSGDFNGDGYADLATGIQWEDIGGVTDAGAVQIVYGSEDGLSATAVPDQFLSVDLLNTGTALEPFAFFGCSLAAGDFNRDGFDDLAVGESGRDIGSVSKAGAVYVINGSTNGLDPQKASEWTQAGDGISGTPEELDGFGRAVAAGDINDDGYADLVVGVDGEAIGSVAGAGCIHVIYGSGTGLTSNGNQILWQGYNGEFEGTAEENDHLGSSLALGDFNGDGYADIAAGAPYETGHATDDGCVMVMYGSGDGIVSDGNWLIARTNSNVSEHFSKSLVSGDFNGDGYADLAIGAPGKEVDGLSNCGDLTVMYGSEVGITVAGAEFHHQGDGVISDTAEAFDIFGETLACGDLNGDGYDDLAIGVPWENIETPTLIDTAGAVHTVFGGAFRLSATGERFWTQDTDGVAGVAEVEDQFGTSLAISKKSSLCTETGVTLWMPAHSFAPGETCGCRATVCNAGTTTLEDYPLFVILEVSGTFLFAPSFTPYDNYLDKRFHPGQTEVVVLPNFPWPEDAGTFNGCMFYGALTDPGITTLVGEMDSWYFHWTE